MKKINLIQPSSAEFTNATVCNEPLFLHVEKKIGELPEGVECDASPLAFSVSREVILEAISCLYDHSTVEIGDGSELLIRFTGSSNGEKKYINHRVVKTYYDFFEESERVRMEIIFKHIGNGVRFVSIDGVVISPLASIGRGTEIHPNTEIRGESSVGENCVIGPCTVIGRSTVGNGCTVLSSHVNDSVIEDGVSVGPFANVKVGSTISSGARVGAFVEVKNSNLGEKTSALHLTYVGDSDVGKNVNFGCGTVTCNYDGKNKHRTTVGDNVFIGCNTNLVAPVTLGDGAFTAAGSTITEDVPAGSLGIARAKQTVKDGWADKKRKEGKLK